MPAMDFSREEIAVIRDNALAVLTSNHIGDYLKHDIASCPDEHFLSEHAQARHEIKTNQVVLRKCRQLGARHGLSR